MTRSRSAWRSGSPCRTAQVPPLTLHSAEPEAGCIHKSRPGCKARCRRTESGSCPCLVCLCRHIQKPAAIGRGRIASRRARCLSGGRGHRHIHSNPFRYRCPFRDRPVWNRLTGFLRCRICVPSPLRSGFSRRPSARARQSDQWLRRHIH